MGAAKGNKNALGNTGGRPTDYKTEYAKQAYNYCLLGATDEDLASFFDVTETTINNWKESNVEFFESVKAGKEVADAKVAQSLYKRATGYKHKAVKIFQVNGEPLIVPYVERYPPDPTSMIFWLKNRQKKKWRDKVEHGVTDSDGNDVVTLFQIPDNGRNANNQTSDGVSTKGTK
jgi:Zn ribbon nucleic-acid-binding protein